MSVVLEKTESSMLGYAARGHINAAMALLRAGQNAKAEQRLRQAIRLEPQHAAPYIELGRMLRTSAPTEALRCYLAAEKLGNDMVQLESYCLSHPDDVRHVSPQALCSASRLDIPVKVLFARNYLGCSSLAETDAVEMYRQHILRRTNGCEPHAFGKASVGDYEQAFVVLIESIKEYGFLRHFAIPVDCNGKILNGAHRLAAALALGLKTVPVITLPAPWEGLEWGLGWFLHSDFEPNEINALLLEWCELRSDDARLLLVEHDTDRIPQDIMAALYGSFEVAGWRALKPEQSYDPNLAITFGSSMRRDFRYVVLAADDAALQQFTEQVAACCDGCVELVAIPAEKTLSWCASLLDETYVSGLHPLRTAALDSKANGVAKWTWYAGNDFSHSRERSGLPGFQKWRNLKLLKDVGTLIDVGVAYGTPDLYRNLEPSHVVLIEPIPYFKTEIERLQNKFPSSQYFPVGLSSSDGTAIINYRRDAPILTSLLESSALRNTGGEDIENLEIEIKRLDSLFHEIERSSGAVLLKIDTEGFELEILKGSVESLQYIKYLVIELSVIERFNDSYTCEELVTFLQMQNFVLYTCLSASVDDQGFCRVVDAVFINRDLHLGSGKLSAQ
ncbi:FkbM family methyltransferase [Candidimonas sp. SYP-B2681]|uniref:FkbM family methyltransferase n=1 Tax=Candidimonas sp. SYP-B2681 TaxID=2497686 RepID=UPI000F8913AA|nr:FkbM family methyltransferase [Candidimonas sp. SYP-B2681]RTZ47584.1 FkbM family methyltransferase [Candidimonas sp. SYP-B2681]